MTVRSTRTEERIRTAVEGVSLNVDFDDEKHEYRLKGKRYPSVTQVIAKAGFDDWKKFVDPAELEFAAERGTAVHKAAELIEEDDLDWDALDPIVRPRAEAYAEWREKSQFRCLFSERRMISHRYGYAGTADLIGLIGFQPAVLDIKAVDAIPESTAIQTVAYAEMLGLTRTLRFALRLDSEGKFKQQEFPDYPDDVDAWRSALTLYRWRNR